MTLDKGKSLTKRRIQAKAREWSGNAHFKASKGWLERFVNRNRFLNLHKLLGMPEPVSLSERFENMPLKAEKGWRRFSERLKVKR